jgi:hypothetical protein
MFVLTHRFETIMDAKQKINLKLEELKNIPGLHEFIMKHGFLAGGAVRDIPRQVEPKDYDIFFKSKEAVEAFKEVFGKRKEFSITGLNNYNFLNFQFITIRFGSPQEVIDSFDWNVNQVYYDFSTDKLGGDGLYTGNQLRLNTKAQKPLSAILRIPYLIKKGFEIEPREYLYALAFTSAVVDMKSSEAVQGQAEFMSAGGGQSGAWGTVERASEEAEKQKIAQSPLMESLK